MACRIVLAFVVWSAAVATGSAADWFTDCWQNFWTDWHRNNCWPEPFVYPDRASVWCVYDAQVAKGWQMQNLLGPAHFDPSGDKLSPAGMAKLRTILTQPPPDFRTVFIERAWTQEATAKRLDAAQQAVAQLVQGPMPEVLVSDSQVLGTPAEYVNAVKNSYYQNLPAVKLPPPQSIDVGNAN
ncbi:MAG: hypothetical protein IT427_13550 [Pirellulales bacterium]|nr:hypothetical protein [Pirellulales bacterium]